MSATADLFEPLDPVPGSMALGPGATLLRGFAARQAQPLLIAVEQITAAAPLRHLTTPGGFRMSVAMTNCGSLGWVSDRTGYRYTREDPDSGRSWPALPPLFLQLAQQAAAQAGFARFAPDACLINSYEPGARLSLHQDKDELDLSVPIVSVSLGIAAVFLFGGLRHSDPVRTVPLQHGDVVVWGGPSRLSYHGVRPLKDSEHRLLGRRRINLTFRKAR
jgi:alkylated DNA repair protein (DNA oxidative demethylase)